MKYSLALFLLPWITQGAFADPFQIKGEFILEVPKRWISDASWRNPYPSISFSDIFYEDEVVFSIEKYSSLNSGELTHQELLKLLTNPKASNPFKASPRNSPTGHNLYERDYLLPYRGVEEHLLGLNPDARESYRRISKKLKPNEREVLAVIARAPRTFYVIHYRAPQDIFEQYWKDFLNFLQSFRLKN